MNAIEQLTAATGFKRPEIDTIFKEVKANQAMLSDCAKPHDFSIALDRRTKEPIHGGITPHQRFGCKWKCSKCGGIVDTLHKLHYEQGLKDAS